MIYILKGRLLKILLVFLRKIEDLTFFFIDSLRTEGKEAKTAPTDLVCKDRACRGLFCQKGLLNRGWIHGYFWVPIVEILRLVEEVFCSALIAPGAHKNFAAKRKMTSAICCGAAISFSSLILTLL